MSAETLEALRARGFANEVGFGRKPAVLVIDFVRGFTDPSSPLGGELDAELDATRRLLDRARDVGTPIFFTTTAYRPDLADAGLFPAKIPSLSVLERGTPAVDIDPRLARTEDEPILEKQYASAFFGTPLSSMLTAAGVDTLIVVGCTTSGCVRASVVDALQYGYRAVVPEECVGDRSAAAHQANLFDIHAKYGDVTTLDRVLAQISLQERT